MEIGNLDAVLNMLGNRVTDVAQLGLRNQGGDGTGMASAMAQIGDWRLEIEDRRPETGDGRPETGDRRPETVWEIASGESRLGYRV